MSQRWFAVMFLTACAAAADDNYLIRVGEPWRFLPGTNPPSMPSTTWRETAFDDSNWPSGPSGFSYNTGGIHEATPLPVLPVPYLSVYFRKSFHVSDLAAVKWLILRMDYDDGFVAYLNGTEVARRGFAAGVPIAFDTPAQLLGQTVGEEIDLSVFAPLLIPGTNVLAVELHNSSFLDGTMVLVPELLANFQRGPLVQDASATAIRIVWKTPVPADTRVEYGTNSITENLFSDATPVLTHVGILTNLQPDTTYRYRISSVAGGVAAVGTIYSFRTLKGAGPVQFAVFGDSGSGHVSQYEIAARVREALPELVLHVGDLIYPMFETRRADQRCLSVFQPHMRTTPYFVVFGNHDLYAGDAHWLEAFHLPTNPATGTEHFYSFDHGDVHFCGLFVPLRLQNTQFPAYVLGDDTVQYRWLTNDLAASLKPWKVLFFHIPFNTSGPHRTNSDGVRYDRLELQRILGPVASRYGVQLILNGHDHAFQRFAPLNGVHSLVTGGGGYPLYPLYERDPANAQYWSVFHFTRVSVTNDAMLVEAVDIDGAVFDSMVIQRAQPAPRVYDATWHSPSLESKPADDGDGNIYGQRFDFAGVPIATLPGRFSNPGQVHVNQDSRNLYLGFRRVMIRGDNQIFLFVESPKRIGVTRMAGLGNGLVDPDGEGVDGLDFLENLSFTNFAPTIACVVGDEFADTSYRYFARSPSGLNAGQGVFRLDPGFSDVPGARLQQFNRSPQNEPVPDEQNADFIEIAIPLGELGNPQAGDILRIGAVVGGAGADTQVDRQTRQLDRAFLGNSLVGYGETQVVLEGVSVRLVPDPDPDRDELTTAEELLLGTEPNNPDTDGDALPDGWEARHQLNPLSSLGQHGASGDPDGDQLTNVQEHLAGTHPLDATSTLRLGVSLSTNQLLRFSWAAVVGRRYQLAASTNLTAPFLPSPTPGFPRTASGLNESVEVCLTNWNGSPMLFRLQLAP